MALVITLIRTERMDEMDPMVLKKETIAGTIVRPPDDGSQDGLVDLDVESNWENVWKQIVLNEDGTVNLGQVKRELFDYWACMQEVTRVYDELTCGVLTKPNTQAQYVLDAVAGWQRAEVMAAIGEVRSELEQEINRAFAQLKKAKTHLNDARNEQNIARESFQITAAYERVEKCIFEVTMAEIEIERLRLIIEARKAKGDCERSTYHE